MYPTFKRQISKFIKNELIYQAKEKELGINKNKTKFNLKREEQYDIYPFFLCSKVESLNKNADLDNKCVCGKNAFYNANQQRVYLSCSPEKMWYGVYPISINSLGNLRDYYTLAAVDSRLPDLNQLIDNKKIDQLLYKKIPTNSNYYYYITEFGLNEIENFRYRYPDGYIQTLYYYPFVSISEQNNENVKLFPVPVKIYTGNNNYETDVLTLTINWADKLGDIEGEEYLGYPLNPDYDYFYDFPEEYINYFKSALGVSYLDPYNFPKSVPSFTSINYFKSSLNYGVTNFLVGNPQFLSKLFPIRVYSFTGEYVYSNDLLATEINPNIIRTGALYKVIKVSNKIPSDLTGLPIYLKHKNKIPLGYDFYQRLGYYLGYSINNVYEPYFRGDIQEVGTIAITQFYGNYREVQEFCDKINQLKVNTYKCILIQESLNSGYIGAISPSTKPYYGRVNLLPWKIIFGAFLGENNTKDLDNTDPENPDKSLRVRFYIEGFSNKKVRLPIELYPFESYLGYITSYKDKLFISIKVGTNLVIDENEAESLCKPELRNQTIYAYARGLSYPNLDYINNQDTNPITYYKQIRLYKDYYFLSKKCCKIYYFKYKILVQEQTNDISLELLEFHTFSLSDSGNSSFEDIENPEFVYHKYFYTGLNQFFYLNNISSDNLDSNFVFLDEGHRYFLSLLYSFNLFNQKDKKSLYRFFGYLRKDYIQRFCGVPNPQNLFRMETDSDTYKNKLMERTFKNLINKNLWYDNHCGIFNISKKGKYVVGLRLSPQDVNNILSMGNNNYLELETDFINYKNLPEEWKIHKKGKTRVFGLDYSNNDRLYLIHSGVLALL